MLWRLRKKRFPSSPQLFTRQCRCIRASPTRQECPPSSSHRLPRPPSQTACRRWRGAMCSIPLQTIQHAEWRILKHCTTVHLWLTRWHQPMFSAMVMRRMKRWGTRRSASSRWQSCLPCRHRVHRWGRRHRWTGRSVGPGSCCLRQTRCFQTIFIKLRSVFGVLWFLFSKYVQLACTSLCLSDWPCWLYCYIIIIIVVVLLDVIHLLRIIIVLFFWPSLLSVCICSTHAFHIGQPFVIVRTADCCDVIVGFDVCWGGSLCWTLVPCTGRSVSWLGAPCAMVFSVLWVLCQLSVPPLSPLIYTKIKVLYISNNVTSYW